MGTVNAIHHLAIATHDIRAQLEFFTEVVGGELVALYWLHGAKGVAHGFVSLEGGTHLAFEQHPMDEAAGGNPGTPPSRVPRPGAMQHVAFNVPSFDALLTMRDRVRSHGVNCVGPIDHGFCQSIYFAGPEYIALEVANSPAPVDADRWIDPTVIEALGLSAEDIDRYRNPTSFDSRGGSVPQPPIDWSGTHIFDDRKQYERLMALDDQAVWDRLSDPEPPVASG